MLCKWKKKNSIYSSIFPQMNIQRYPFQQIWSESIICFLTPIWRLRASKSAVRIIHLPVVTLHINMQSSSGARGGWLLHLVVILPFLSALVLLWIWPGCYLRSCWKKSARTNPTLNFQQRRENTSAVIQFNVVLFELSSRHISVKLFCNNVTHTHTLIHWLYHVSCSHVSVKCSLSNSVAGLLMAWLKPNEIF